MTPSIVHIVYVEQLLSVNIKNNVPFTYPVFLTVQWFLLRTLVSCLCCESPLWKRRTAMDVVRIIQLIYVPDHPSTLLRSPILANENSLFLRNKWMRANISHCDSRSTNFNFNLSIFRNTSTLLKKENFLISWNQPSWSWRTTWRPRLKNWASGLKFLGVLTPWGIENPGRMSSQVCSLDMTVCTINKYWDLPDSSLELYCNHWLTQSSHETFLFFVAV